MGSVFQPVLAAIAGVIFLKEHVTKREKTGLTIALLGSLVITFEPLVNGSGKHLGSLFGNFLLIGSRLADTISTVMAKTILRLKVSPLALTHISFITGFITMIPIVLVFHSPFSISNSLQTAPIGAHLGVFYMALLSGTLAYTLFHAAERTVEIGEATVSYYLHPVFSAPLSFIWLQEPITPAFITGCLIVATGVFLAGIKRKAKA
jgi:drug/metabolite transporter (DMT)-like permease